MNAQLSILLYGALATVLHEGAHAAAAHFRGCKVKSVVFNRRGIGIRRGRGTEEDTAVIAAAGPLASLLLAFLFQDIPGFCFVNLVMAAINLLPLPLSDGSKILAWLRSPGTVHNAR